MNLSDILWTVFFLFWIYTLIAPKGLGKVPRYPPPPEKSKCICNDIEKQTPGGHCEYCWNKKNIVTRPELPEDRIN